MRRVLKWIGIGVLGLAVLVVLAGGGGYLWLRSSLPQVDGTVRVAGLSAAVTIARDDRGVPTITAANLDDAAFAIGFTHAQDRLFQMDMMRRVGAGRLSEVVGAQALPVDKLMRTLGLYQTAAQQAEDASPALKKVLASYSAGVNAFLAQGHTLPPEFQLLRYKPEPWTPADSLLWGRIMALQLSSNWNAERMNLTLQRTIPADLLKLLQPEVQSFAGLPLPWFGPVNEASNNWVVGPAKSTSGAPLLANDPHLGLTAPSIWYLVHVVTPERQWVGATSPGMPMIVIGANDRVAWGFTTTTGDTEDLFEEREVAGDPKRYQTFYGSEAFLTQTETIKVKDGKDVALTVRSTHHGPVISDLDDGRKPTDPILALAAAFLWPDDRTADALLAMDLAQSADEFRNALAGFASPQQNVVYADKDGHIGFVAAGRVPVRRQVFAQSLLPTPGWIDDYDWTGMIPFDALPQARDPAAGWLATANNKIVDDRYAYFMAGSWPDDRRYRRIAEMLQATERFDVAGFEKMQQDTLSKPLRDLVQSWLPKVKDAPRPIVDLLQAWDGRVARDRPEPLIATVWMERVAQALLQKPLGKSYEDWWFWDDQALQRVLADPKWCGASCDHILGDALQEASKELSARLGPDPSQWKWGDLHRLHFRHPIFRYVPLLSNWLDADLPTDGDTFTVNRAVPLGNTSTPDLPDVHGPSMRLIVDLKDPLQAVATLAGGQSGNPLSAHYADGLPDWRDGHYRPIVQPAVHQLTLTPGN
jgi:penicillin G amidase